MTIVGALPFTLQNGTTADATQVMADFNSIKTDVNTNAAAAGANNDITSLAGLTTPLSTGQGGTGTATPANLSAGGYRNIARRNGGLEIWQRGAGGAASIAVGASTTAYAADGWYLMANANQASVVSQQAGLTNGSQWCARVQRNSGQTGTGQMVWGFPLDTDEIYPLLGQYVRLSLTLKAGANWSPASGNLSVVFAAGTGTPVKLSVGYTGQTNPISSTQAITSSAVRYQFNSAAVVPTTTRQAEITMLWTPVGTASTNDYFEIDDVQLEIVPASSGYVASNFERLLFNEQLELCLRHYQKTFNYVDAPATNTALVSSLEAVGVSAAQPNWLMWIMPVTLRTVTPVLTTYNRAAANAQIRNVTDGADFSSTTTTFYSPCAVKISGTVNGGMGAGDLITVHCTADAGI